MTSSKAIGRAVGLLLLVQLVTGLILPYVLLLPVSARPGTFLDSAAGMETTVRLSVLMLFVGGAVSVGVAVLAWPILRERQPQLGLWLLVLAAVNFTLQLIENVQWLSLLSISQAYAAAGPAGPEAFRAVGLAAHASFRWAHYSHILIVVAWLFMLNLAFYRGAIAPRLIPAFGMVAALLHFIGITLPVFGGYRMPSPDLFGAPLGLAIFTLAAWLMARGVATMAPPSAEAAHIEGK